MARIASQRFHGDRLTARNTTKEDLPCFYRRIASLLAAALFAALAAAPAAAQPKDKAILLLNWYVYSEHAPFFLGKERGYFADEGIDLDIQEGRGSGVTVQAVAAGTRTSATRTCRR